MSNVDYIIGNKDFDASPLSAYSDEAIAFLSDLSSQIIKSPLIRAYPDIAALGFWIRKGNIIKLKEKCPEAAFRLGRGICLHIAPSNIPINFAFSYIFGLLSGCSNIVRLPSRTFPQSEATIELIKNVLVAHREIANRSIFVKYPADNTVTESFSMIANARMIWGGDHTISNIRGLKTSPKCIDIAFPDRYSLCIIDGKSLLKVDSITQIAENFYNDTYLMDQNACSSPQVICWLNDDKDARERFWLGVREVAQRKYSLYDSICVDKYTKACEDSINHFDYISEIKHEDSLLYRVELKELMLGIESYRGKCGYFYEYSMKSLSDIVPIVTEKFQTVTYFGINPKEIRDVVLQNKLKGIDRITPLGRAMDIGIIWDGYDIVRMLSRIVNIE